MWNLGWYLCIEFKIVWKKKQNTTHIDIFLKKKFEKLSFLKHKSTLTDVALSSWACLSLSLLRGFWLEISQMCS